MSPPENPVVCVIDYEDGESVECASWHGAERRVEAEYPGTTITRRGARRECRLDDQRVATIRAR
jgi:hypothetical protein